MESCCALRGGNEEGNAAEFDQEEAEWRETAEGQVLNLCEIENPLPTPGELDELDLGVVSRSDDPPAHYSPIALSEG